VYQFNIKLQVAKSRQRLDLLIDANKPPAVHLFKEMLLLFRCAAQNVVGLDEHAQAAQPQAAQPSRKT
jgi:hypothetical protein